MRALALLLALAGCTGGGVAVDPGPDLAWSALVGDDLEVFVRKGGAVSRLSRRAGADFAGPLSPQRDALLVIHSDDETGMRLWLHPLDGSAAHPLSSLAPLIRNPRWSPEGDAVVYESSEASFRDIYRSDRAGHATRLSAAPHGCFEPAPLPGGAGAIAACSGDDVDLYRLTGAEDPRLALLVRAGEDGAPALSPDGRQLAFLAAEGPVLAVHLFDLQANSHRRLWAPDDPGRLIVADQGLAWSPSGRRLALVTRAEGSGPQVHAVEVETGRVLTRLPGDLPSWGPDGSLFVTHEDEVGQGVFVLPAEGGGLRRVAPVGSWLGRPL